MKNAQYKYIKMIKDIKVRAIVGFNGILNSKFQYWKWYI